MMSFRPARLLARKAPSAALLAALALFSGGLVGAAPQLSPFESAEAVPRGEIDRAVFDRLQREGISPAYLCSDEVFIRRVYLDVIGTLPEPDDARAFLNDPDRRKRALLIDELLARDEFAAYWAMKWGDLLRIKAEFPINLWPNAVQAYDGWVRRSIRENMPYDRFVRALLTSSGSNFRVPPVNFYRAVQGKEPETLASAVALTFMGTRLESWPSEEREQLVSFFSRVGFKSTTEWKEEIVYFDAGRSEADGAVSPALFPDGSVVELALGQDPREAFADWLITPENEWFAANIVNRAWYWLQGRGIVHPADDFRSDNPPANPELLALLERELVEADYDLKHVFRLILNSSTYQLSSIARSRDPQAEALFAYYPVRRLDAEVLIDALCQITETTEEYSSAIPEPFTFVPEEARSIELPDGSITSSFLEMFGRPSRDTGLESERNNKSTANQRLHLLNSSHIRDKIEKSERFRGILRSRRSSGRPIDRLYLLILSRHPTSFEMRIAKEYVESDARKGREAAIDLAWALINSTEFLYRH